MSATKDEIEKLKEKKDDAWDEWLKLDEPAKAAYKKYEEAHEKWQHAVLYEKVRRRVLRDLISSANLPQP